MVPDGYGVCYNPMEEHINMAITAFNSCEETNAARFAQAIEGALLDMRVLLEDAAATAEQWSRTLAKSSRKWLASTRLSSECFADIDEHQTEDAGGSLKSQRNENLYILSEDCVFDYTGLNIIWVDIIC